MPKYTFTAADVVEEVRKLAAERPGFVYTEQGLTAGEFSGCSYLGRSVDNPDTGEACIVGQALARLGVHRSVLDEHEGWGGGQLAEALGLVPESKVGNPLHPMASWLHQVQAHQDGGMPWGEAVARADEAAGLPDE